jgi:tRNA_anti-like
VTTASALYRDYQANEVATNMKIGKAPIEVTGIVLSIDESFSGSPRVALSTGSSIDRALFSVLETEKAEVAKLSKGDAATFRCASMQRLLGSPIGSECTLFYHLSK